MTETEFEQAVVDLAHIFGWMVAGFRPAMTGKGWRTPVKHDGKGYPDLTLVHPCGAIIVAELKTGRGRRTPEQLAWADVFADVWANGVPVYRLWRPSDGDEIVQLLSHGRVTAWPTTERTHTP